MPKFLILALLIPLVACRYTPPAVKDPECPKAHFNGSVCLDHPVQAGKPRP